jgi:hypothetical protein
MWDVFVSHASEDKESVARPIAMALEANGLRTWLDAQELNVGDSLRRKLDEGLLSAQFGIVILSHSFFAKKWTQLELDALVSLEEPPDKLILPVWHEVTADEIRKLSPILASKLATETSRGLDEVVIALVRSIRNARQQTSGEWLKFDDGGRPDEAAIKRWLHAGAQKLSRPYIAWPTDFLITAADLTRRQAALASTPPIDGRRGWYKYEGRELRDFELDFLTSLPTGLKRLDDLLPLRLVNLANGLKEYGKGLHIAQWPVRNFLFLWYRHLRNQFLAVKRYIGQECPANTLYLEDIRALISHGSRELASAHVQYIHQPNHFDVLERSLRGFRMWEPRRCIEDARNEQQWYVPAELFEEYFIPQLELRMMLEFDKAALIYSAHRERWDLSSFKDEAGEYV